MTEPVKRTTPAQTSQKPQQARNTQNQKPKQSNEPSIGRLLLNRAGLVVMTPIAGVAGVLTIATSAIAGTINPKKTFDQGMQEGIQAAGQGADMLEQMWNGKYF